MKAIMGLVLIVVGLFFLWGGVTGRIPAMIDAFGSGRKKQGAVA